MPQHLSDLDLDEVSAVRNPANPGAEILFFKMKEEDNEAVKKKKITTFIKQYLIKYWGDGGAQTFDEKETTQEFNSSICTLTDSLYSITNDGSLSDDDKLNLIKESVGQFVAELSGTADDSLAKEKDDMPKELTEKEKAQAYDDLQKKNADEAVAKAAKEKADAEEAAKAADLKKAQEDINKANQEKIEKQDKLLKEQGEEIAKMKADKEAGVRLEKSKSILEGVGGIEPQDLADVMKGLDKDQTEKLEKIFKAVAEQAKLAGIYKSQGSGTGGSGKGVDALQKLEAKADELMKGDAKLTKEAAFTKACQAEPKLYDEYNASKQ